MAGAPNELVGDIITVDTIRDQKARELRNLARERIRT